MNSQVSSSVPLVMTTCYDVSSARICGLAQCLDYVLVGDSVGMVVYGDSSTCEVSLSEMCRHVQAVRRGLDSVAEGLEKMPILMADFPAGTYDTCEESLKTARALREAGAESFKLEGPVYEQVRALVGEGFSVCGHVGLTPQSIQNFRLQAKTPGEARRVFNESKELEKAGVDMLVLELIPAPLAREITGSVGIPTIGIGAGVDCSGQVLVLPDLLGMNTGFQPRFLKTYAQAEQMTLGALRSYAEEVRQRKFPGREHSFFDSGA